MSGFKEGDKVVYISPTLVTKYEYDKLYTVDNVIGHFISTEEKNSILHISRFRKAIKRKDNAIIRKLCKVYKEEDGYIWV